MKLFHISTDLNHCGFFTPSFPLFHLEGEEATIKRVSTSFSMAGALTAMPRGGFLLRETLEKNDGLLRIFELDVFNTDLTPEDLVLPYTLTKKGWVADALVTEEVWVLKPFQAQRLLDVRVLDWKEYEDDLYPDWLMNKPKNIPVMTVIENINIQIIKETIIDEEKELIQQNVCQSINERNCTTK